MPYYITDKSSECPAWAVVKADGELVACHDTKQSAIDQAIAISLSEKEEFMGERAAVGLLKSGDWVSWLPNDSTVLGQVVVVENELAVVRVFEYDNAVFSPTDKLMFINVFSIEKIERPERIATEFELDSSVDTSVQGIEPDEEFMSRAMPDELEVGDYVSWRASGGRAYGQIADIERNGEVTAPETDFTITGTPDDPAALIQLYEKNGSEWKATQIFVVHRFTTLTKISTPGNVSRTLSIRNKSGDPIIISDIDGTLLNAGNRIDKVWEYIQDLDGALFLVTGRPESERDKTVAELNSADISYSRLIMNPGSTSDSPAYKKETATRLLKTYNVIAAIENNSEALANYRELGIEAVNPRNIPAIQRAINQKAPAYMRSAARRGLKYYEEGLGGAGLTAKTIREARLMAEGQVSDDKWVRIAAWIARHMPDLDAPKNSNRNDPQYPGPGLVAHLLWGSGPSKTAAERAMTYAEGVVARIRAEENRMAQMEEKRKKWLDVASAIQRKIDGEPEKAKEPEVRTNTVDFEIRSEGDGMTFTGYASVFNSSSEDLGGFREFVAPGAFKRSLQSRNEIKLLWNHDTNEPLASVRGGSLQLQEDNYGLKVTAKLPNTTRGRDVAELIRSKVIDSMSFGFNVIKDSWSKDGQTRTLESVRLHEVSIVTFPAYAQTVATVRSMPTIDADELATALLKLESGEELEPTHADLITDVVNKLRKEPEVQEAEDNGLSLLDLKKKQLDLLMKRI